MKILTRRSALVAAGILLLVPSALGAQEGEQGEEEQEYESVGRLSLQWVDTTGPGWVYLFVEKGDPEIFQNALRATLGCEPSPLETEGMEDTIALYARCPGLLERHGLALRGTFDFTPLAETLRAAEIPWLSVTVTHQALSITRIEAPVSVKHAGDEELGRYHYFDVRLGENPRAAEVMRTVRSHPD